MSRLATTSCLALSLALLGLVASVQAQVLSETEQAKLDPRFRTVVARAWPAAGVTSGARAAEPIHGAVGAKGGPARYRALIRTDRPERLRTAGIPVNAVLRSIVTARVTADDLVRLAQMEEVRYVDAGGMNEPHNDIAAGVSGIRLLNNGHLNGTSYKGEGVIACIIDSGIDYTHLDFRDLGDDTQSRILSIWDQELTPQGAEQSPSQRHDGDFSGFDYGVEYNQAEIEDEIDGSPADFVRQIDDDGHGTHVAGTMAGNSGGDPERRYTGMVPEAHVIAVKTDFSFNGVIDGMSYCGEVAADRSEPVVVNMSLGSDGGPHDGTGGQDIAITDWANAASGRVVVSSAGNSAADMIHTSGTIDDGNATAITIEVPTYTADTEDEDDLGIDIWLSGSNSASVTVTSPSGETATAAAGNSATESTTDGRIQIDNVTSAGLGGGDREIFIGVDDEDGTPPAAGDWTITITNTSGGPFTFHSWLFDAELGSGDDPVFATTQGGDGDYTVGSPGSADGAIAAGSYVHRWRWCAANDVNENPSDDPDCFVYSNTTDRSGDISSFSSRGPRRDGTLKPEIAAPGQGTGSTASADMGLESTSNRLLAGEQHRLTQGTSMSSPVVAGAAVLLLQEDGNLTAGEIKEHLTGAAWKDGFTDSTPNNKWGYGKLDAVGAMAQAINPSSSASREILAYDEVGNSVFSTVDDGEMIAVRFTPQFSGVVTGALFHTNDDLSLSSPLDLEVWSDDGSGLPDQKLGSTVQHPGGKVARLSWNYVDITDTGVGVAEGTDYHLILTVQSGDEMETLAEQGSVDGRSSRNSFGSWNAFSADWRLRPIVSSTSGVGGALPVQLVAFEAVIDGEAAVLTWTTASETNNAGFAVEHRRPNAETFAEVGFVDGAGTTDEPQHYRFRVAALQPGTHAFRLRQVDADGAVTYGPTEEIVVGLKGKYALSEIYPNPAPGVAQVQLAVRGAQRVRAVLYNLLGQRVRTLYDGRLTAGTSHALSFAAPDLASGLYIVRLEGETFSAVRRFMVVR